MVRQIVWPRMSQDDFAELVRAHGCIVAADAALRKQGGATALAVIELVGQADQVIARLHNKADAALRRQLEPIAAAMAPAGAPAANATQTPNQEHYGAPAKPED